MTETGGKIEEYTSNQAIIKSQKILNSTSNFHLKTEQENEDHKSPEQNRGEMREMWRKPRMPYSKLPQAFQMKSKELGAYSRKKTSKEAVENIDKIVKYNEYKETQKYLDPIQLEKKSEEKPKEKLENGNPLTDYQKYIQLTKKFKDQLKEQDISINRFKTLSSKPGGQAIKLSECITLQVIKRGHNTGTLKKALHVPTLKLLCVREEPLNTKEARQAIKEWLQFWQSKLNSEQNERFITISSTYFNSPEGAVSVITQYFKRGSLLNLLNIVMTLPETAIRSILIEILACLEQFYELTDMHFGGLSPSQIMFTSEGKIKLCMGLFYHFPHCNFQSIYHLKTLHKNKQANIFDFNSTNNRFMKSAIQKPLNLELQRSLDVFKIGLIVLECAIGGFQNFEQSALLHDSLKAVFTEEGQRMVERDKVCCLIHSQIYLLEHQQDDRSRRDRFEPSKSIQYIKLLKDRFSNQFISLLCQCLTLCHSKRPTLKQLASHSFLRNQISKDSKTVKVDLLDLLQISCDWSHDNYVESGKQERLDKFIGHILHVLSDCRKETLVELVTNEKDKVLNLAKEISVNYLGLGERLYDAIMQMIKSDK